MRSPQAGTGDEVADGQMKYFVWGSCMQLCTYTDNESRSIIWLYVLTLDV